MAKLKYLSNFDFIFCNSTPFLAYWIMTTPMAKLWINSMAKYSG